MTLRLRAAQPDSISLPPRRRPLHWFATWMRAWLLACMLLPPVTGFAQGTLVTWGLGLDGQTTPPPDLGGAAGGHQPAVVQPGEHEDGGDRVALGDLQGSG